MPRFLIESYLAAQPAAVTHAATDARRVAELADGIAYLRTTYIPGDETCLHLFQAPSAAALGAAARLAAFEHLRIVEAVEAVASPSED